MARAALLFLSSAASVACKGSSGSGPVDGKVGIPACDDYITKMEACIAKMDPVTKATTETSFKHTREEWTLVAAGGGAAKEALTQACESAVAALPATCK